MDCKSALNKISIKLLFIKLKKGMFKIDTELIKDRLSGVSFSFLTEEEIKRLSVVEVKST